MAPYSSEPLRTVLLARAAVLRACEDRFIIAALKDLCGDDVPEVVRKVRVRAWCWRLLRLLSEELVRSPEANVAMDLQHVLDYRASLPQDVVEAVTRAHMAAEGGHGRAAAGELRTALVLIDRSPVEFDLRGIE